MLEWTRMLCGELCQRHVFVAPARSCIRQKIRNACQLSANTYLTGFESEYNGDMMPSL